LTQSDLISEYTAMCLWILRSALLGKELTKACEAMAIVHMSGIHKVKLT